MGPNGLVRRCVDQGRGGNATENVQYELSGAVVMMHEAP